MLVAGSGLRSHSSTARGLVIPQANRRGSYLWIVGILVRSFAQAVGVTAQSLSGLFRRRIGTAVVSFVGHGRLGAHVAM